MPSPSALHGRVTNDAIVSFDDEPLILVDADDRVLGYESKAACHAGEGKLHRAFSVFVFNGKGQLMLQQRSGQKPLWPGFWSNSCCSHPRRGEQDAVAANRRVAEELGVSPPLTYLFKFEYHARFGRVGSEHELCSVYAARSDGPIEVNVNEVSDWRWVDVEVFEADVAAQPDTYTPWLKLEWPRIRREHWSVVRGLF